MKNTIPKLNDVTAAIVQYYGDACNTFFRNSTKDLAEVWLPYLETWFSTMETTYDKKTLDIFHSVWDQVGLEMLAAPASGNRNYHCSHPMGLLVHSIEVMRLAETMLGSFEAFSAANGKKVSINKGDLLIAGFFHDLGKCGDTENVYYSFETSDWHREKLGRLFSLNPDSYTTSHSELSTLRLGNLTELSLDIYQAVRFHDGQYIPENKSVAHKERPLTLLLHQADYWAAHIYKE